MSREAFFSEKLVHVYELNFWTFSLMCDWKNLNFAKS